MENVAEIRKLTTLSLVWLTITFVVVWIACWALGIGLPMALDVFFHYNNDLLNQILRFFVPALSILVFIPINAMFMVLLERRALAIFTVRKGPNRVGPDGYLQTMADAVKLLLKEDITPIGADAVMFTMAPIIFFAPSIIGAVPLLAAVTNDHPLFHMLNLPTGIFYVLAAGAIPVVALVMAGWASNNKYSLVGGLRSAAQAISYEIPLVLSLISVCLMAGTLDLVKIAQQQAGGILNWNILGGGVLTGVDKYIAANIAKSADIATILPAYYPFGAASAVAAVLLVICLIISLSLYLTGACAEINRIPFDLPEAESELVSGYNTEYSGMKFAIFFLAEFTNLFIVASITTVMFLGGGDNPIPPYFMDMTGLNTLISALRESPICSQLHLINPETLFSTLWVIFKVYSIVFFAILVRGTLPRFRIDQLIAFGWKRLIPLSLIVFLVLVFARGFVICHG